MLRTESVPRSKHSPYRLHKTSLLMLYKTNVAVCSEIRTEHVTQCEHHVEFLNIKPSRKVTTTL